MFKNIVFICNRRIVCFSRLYQDYIAIYFFNMYVFLTVHVVSINSFAKSINSIVIYNVFMMFSQLLLLVLQLKSKIINRYTKT